VGRETVDAAITVWRHDLLSLCSTTLMSVVDPFTTGKRISYEQVTGVKVCFLLFLHRAFVVG
jgi:hypothetical protein